MVLCLAGIFITAINEQKVTGLVLLRANLIGSFFLFIFLKPVNGSAIQNFFPSFSG